MGVLRVISATWRAVHSNFKFTVTATVLLLGFSSFNIPPKAVISVSDHVAKCYGSASCGACKTCNYCAHCNAGGTCGVCSSVNKTVTRRVSSASTGSYSGSSQCQGTTKKGARCKRMVRGGGYCWQHAG